MLDVVTSLGIGLITGFIGAIPPGPVGIAVMQRAAEGDRRAALRIGLGGAALDTLICACIAFGAGPFLATLASNSTVRIALSAICAAVGVFIIVEALVRPHRHRRRLLASASAKASGAAALKPKPAPTQFLDGVLRAAANPSSFLSWLLVVAALTGSGILKSGPLDGASFALGIGLGVFGWFALVAHIVDRARGPSLTPWVRVISMLAGAALVISGSLAAFRAIVSG